MLKIEKLEKLCRALQEERVVLYDKIKEIRQANSAATSKVVSSSEPEQSDLLTATEIQELQEMDPVLTEDMSRLKEEQAKLQEFAASLFATPMNEEEQEEKPQLDPEEDEVSSAFIQFKTKTQTKVESDSIREQVENPPEEAKDQSHHEATAAQQPPAEPEPTPGPAHLNPEAEPEASTQTSVPVQVLDEAEQRQEEQATVAPPSDSSATSSSDSSKKQTSKKKKKRNTKNAS